MAKWQGRQYISWGWMFKTRSNVVEYQCSKCKHWAVKLEGTLDYEKCPHCGALMSANDEQVTGKLKEDGEKKSCLNCGTSECELGNRDRYGFCGNWTMREGAGNEND